MMVVQCRITKKMRSPHTILTLDEVNVMSDVAFIETFSNILEHSALCAGAVSGTRPFTKFDDINNAFTKFTDDLSVEGKEGVLRLYPDLAGSLAQSGQLTSESAREHLAAGLNNMTEVERDTMFRLNAEYKDKFGFPFVICARLNQKDAILKGLETRLRNTRRKEATAGINEVKKIVCLRLKDIVDERSVSSRP